MWQSLGSGLSGIGQSWANTQATKRTTKYNARQAWNQMLFQAYNQERFAKHGLQWKVQDAKQAGLHPLAAIGANTHSFSPMAIGSNASPPDVGSGIGQAIRAAFDVEGRKLRHIQLLQEREKLDNMRLINVGLKKQQMENDAKPPPIETTQSGVIIGQKSNRMPAMPGTELVNTKVPISASPGLQAGIVAGQRYAMLPNHQTMEVVSEPVQEAIESDYFAQAQLFGYRLSELIQNYKKGLGDKYSKAAFAFKRIERRPKEHGYKYLWSIGKNAWIRTPDPHNKIKRFFTNQDIPVNYFNPGDVKTLEGQWKKRRPNISRYGYKSGPRR